MSFEEKLKLINSLDVLIKRKTKGSACLYASKLGISRSGFFRLLEFMKADFNIPIVYNSELQRYQYAKEGVMYFGFISAETIPLETLKKISGGSVKSCKKIIENNLASPNWWDCQPLSLF